MRPRSGRLGSPSRQPPLRISWAAKKNTSIVITCNYSGVKRSCSHIPTISFQIWKSNLLSLSNSAHAVNVGKTYWVTNMWMNFRQRLAKMLVNTCRNDLHFFREAWIRSSVEVRTSCISRKMLHNDNLKVLANISFDTTENEPPNICCNLHGSTFCQKYYSESIPFAPYVEPKPPRGAWARGFSTTSHARNNLLQI